MNNIEVFALRVAELEDSLCSRACALIWYLTEIEKENVSINDVPALLKQYGLSKSPNPTRIKTEVKANGNVSYDKKTGLCRIRLPFVPKYYERYPVQTSPQTQYGGQIVDEAMYASTRDYILTIIKEINAAYNAAIYDGCAVMMRRLVESLIIETYVVKGHNPSITVSGTGEFMMLRGLVTVVQAGHPIKFSRNLGKILESIKDVGDRAAHHRTYITRKNDIDKLTTEFNVALDELIRTAGIK